MAGGQRGQAIGFDCFSEYCARLPDFTSEDFIIHKVILENGSILMQQLTNLSQLPTDRRFQFFAPFIKIRARKAHLPASLRYWRLNELCHCEAAEAISPASHVRLLRRRRLATTRAQHAITGEQGGINVTISILSAPIPGRGGRLVGRTRPLAAGDGRRHHRHAADQRRHLLARTGDGPAAGRPRLHQPHQRHHAIGATDHATQLLALEEIPMLQDAAHNVGGWSIRNMGTVGGNLFAPPPAGDVAVALLALDASRAGQRNRGAGDAPGRVLHRLHDHRLQPDELVAEIQVPVPAGKTVYLKYGRREANTPSIVTVAAHIALDGERVRDARLALNGVGPHPFRARRAEARWSARRWMQQPSRTPAAGGRGMRALHRRDSQ